MDDAASDGSDPDADAVEEVARITDALAAAQRRLESARFRAASREAAAREALRAELVAIRSLIAAVEQRHSDDVAAVRATARQEAQRIVDDARLAVLGKDGEPDGGD